MGSGDTPGLKRRKRADGSYRTLWIARPDIIEAGYQPKVVNLDGLDKDLVALRCQQLQDEMLRWMIEWRSGRTVYNGRLRSLIAWYETAEESPFRDLKPNSQTTYREHLKILTVAKGSLMVEGITGGLVRQWHKELSEKSSPGYAKLTISVLRAALSFGASMRHSECMTLLQEISVVRFSGGGSRKLRMTYAQLQAFRAAALKAGRPSIALGLSLQYELAFRQIDVIGERDRDGRWCNGLTGANIDAQGVLRKQTTKTGAPATHRIADYPELDPLIKARLAVDRTGPLVINELTGRPYTASVYRTTFRTIARAASILDEIQSRDARSGAVTESYEAGASVPDAMALATHSTPSISRLYNRDNVEASSRVAKLRVKSRKGDEQ